MWPFDSGCGEHHYDDGEVTKIRITHRTGGHGVSESVMQELHVQQCLHCGCNEKRKTWKLRGSVSDDAFEAIRNRDVETLFTEWSDDD